MDTILLRKSEKFGKPFLRWIMSFVFLYFGFQQLTNLESWIAFVPNFVLTLGFSAKTIVLTNSLFELSFGILLFLGIYTRFVALILSIHLYIIAFSLGLNPLGIRDFALASATFSIFLNGPDFLSLESKFKK